MRTLLGLLQKITIFSTDEVTVICPNNRNMFLLKKTSKFQPFSELTTCILDDIMICFKNNSCVEWKCVIGPIKCINQNSEYWNVTSIGKQ